LIRAARDHGKSYFWDVAFPIWKAEFYQPSDIYIFSSSQSMAEDRLNETRRELLNNPRHAHLLPSGNIDRIWNKRELVVGPSRTRIRARGWGVRVRGGHPPVIVCDDVLDDRCLYSETIRKKAEDYFFSVLVGMITPEGQIIVCGTPFHFADLYAKIEETKVYAVSTFKALNRGADGELTSLFPERYSVAQLLHKRDREIGTARFAREYQAQPLTDEASLFPSHLFEGKGIRVPYKLGMPAAYWEERGAVRYAGVDIAMSSSSSADYFVMFSVAVDPQGNRWIANIRRKKGLGFQQQLDIIKEEFALLRHDVIHIESNQMQRVWTDELRATTDLPIRAFFTSGVQPAQPWKRGMTSITMGKHSLDRGVPSLRMGLENKKWRIPRGDAKAIAATDIWIGEMQCMSMQGGKVVSVGEHDDLVMACWMTETAVQLGGASFYFVGDEEKTREVKEIPRISPAKKEEEFPTEDGFDPFGLSVYVGGQGYPTLPK
jgi:hypothetical protein